MKLETCLFFLLMPELLFSQCNLQTEKDPFNGMITSFTKYEVLGRSIDEGTLRLKCVRHILGGDTIMYLFVYLTPTRLSCFGGESKVLIKSGETIITLNLSGDIKCGNRNEILADFAQLSNDDIYFLKQNKIDMIRIHFTEGYGDFSIRKSDYFIRTLKCFQ